MKTTIVLINVNCVNARKVCELIENQVIDDFDNNCDLAELHLDNNDEEQEQELYIIYPLTDFMDAFNNEEINEKQWFITYVLTPSDK